MVQFGDQSHFILLSGPRIQSQTLRSLEKNKKNNSLSHAPHSASGIIKSLLKNNISFILIQADLITKKRIQSQVD